MSIERWPSGAPGRSRTVAHGDLVWTVANATDPAAAPDFPAQVTQTLAALDDGLREAGSSPDPSHWPQRACFEGKPAPGLLIEVMAVAARSR